MTQRTDMESLDRRASSGKVGNTHDSARSRSRQSARNKALGRRRRRRLLMEGLETRQLLAAETGFVDPGLFPAVQPRNIGAVQSFKLNEGELGGQFGSNDSLLSADFLPLGTGAGQQDTIDVTGSMGFVSTPQGNIVTDVDTYAFDLRAGDILDVSVIGAGANLTVFYENGRIWWGTDTNTAISTYSDGSPLMTVGNAVGAQVVPEDGRYYVNLAPSFTNANYTLGLRAYRPVMEKAPIGAKQILYLDFDGGTYPSSDFFPSVVLPFGQVRLLGLPDSLDVLGFTNPLPGDADAIIDATVEKVKQEFATLGINGFNGDFDSSGIPGEYGITILNSRDHADPGDQNGLVTRVVIGSEVTQGLTDFGLAQNIDVGNFRPYEKVLVTLEAHAALAATYPRAPSASLVDAVAQQLAGTITHEAGHSFGIYHTDGTNFVENIMDEGSASLDDYLQGIGPDGVFGTADDIIPMFNDDRFAASEGLFFGVERVPASLSYALSTGTVGTTISGRVFADNNRDAKFGGDAGLAGVTVYADANNNGLLDPTDPQDVTDANGNYTLAVAGGTCNVIAITPDQYAPTTQTVISTSGGASGVNFGFVQVIPDVTGTKFADTNGNGFFDEGESGIEGFYIYLDLDGDDRPDLGEPSDRTDANGRYSINFPGPGTYTIREVVPPGYIQTFPTNGEHVVTYNGIALADNYNFGNLPSRDYGDAPDTYRTSVAANGPSHGISTGFGLGATVDRETNGFPSDDALGDDNNNIDDEDGVQLLSPLGPGGTATVQVTTRNNTNTPGFLQGWIDFDASGTFESDERVFTNVELAAGTSTLSVDVPNNAVVGSTFARFRYSATQNLGVGGEADLGEVEDYQFDILEAAAVANDDEFTVSRNSLSNQLDVLANDFESSVTQLTIVGRNVAGTAGTVVIAQDGRSIFYTPPNGFTGRDVFQYTVEDQLGNRYTATVTVNVNFQSTVPIAVDDTFEVPQGSANRALNVLDNDVPSIFGGLSITSVSAGDQGGQVSIEGGGQTIRYTPQPGFAGTEQFTYSIQDANGSTSQAEVTVNTLPGARNDDLIDFTIGIYDVVNNQPISNVQVGQPFNVRVFVEELNNPNFSPEGVASAFLDLLYTDELVSTRDTNPDDAFGFDITFGPNFQGGGFKLGDATIPGLINDVGAVQPIPSDGNLIEHSDPAELFTITMTAVSPGVAVFASDPADDPVAETILVGEDVALTVAQQRLGRTELTIFPASDNFSSAIDDSFPSGTDSDGRVITAGNAPNRLDVLANDNLGPTGQIREFGIATQAGRGTVLINDNNTPDNLNDDYVEYYADVNANGFDTFTYLIVTDDGVRSTAEVSLALGNASQDDLVEISFDLVDQLGNPISSVRSGDTFGVQVLVEDLRPELQGNTYVFAAYLDMLYDSGLISPASVPPGGRFDFDVDFDSDFDTSSGVGTAARDGIIDEFGTLLRQTVAESGSVIEPNLMATVYFVAGQVLTPTSTRIVGDPADASPFQDTLLFDRDDPVEVSQIRYDSLNITINPAGPQQNTALPEDVNNDGNVTPSDALSVINAIARGGEGELSFRGLYTDVNGDQVTSAVDALRVINRLARDAELSLAGEGESVVSDQLEVASIAVDDSAPLDEALADLSGPGKLVTVDSSGSSDSPESTQLLDFNAGSDEDEALLSLLADDQSQLA
ncbi:adhesin [Roseiconus nitratireducens]|uniref:Adhesin n=1 Tax=Roseiconus nitratireducens TaxID=2605748 RepID=A0A5M6DBD0_9BACT|nr:Ig-like domain-containing protein [Roseiconus nitratireducens]KAA5543622.1 adhesin [Roseiconus nitratireducens]